MVELRRRGADLGSLRTVLPGAAAIVVAPAITVDGELLDAAGSSLAVVANFGVGYDNIDLDAARATRRAGDQHARGAHRCDRGARRRR